MNNWDPSRLQAALNEFAAGKVGLRQLSRAWNIPKSTLQCRISGKVTRPGHASGRPTALTSVVEHDLAEYLRNLSQRGFPLRALDVRRIAYEFAVKNGISGIGSEKTGIAGRFWFRRFMSHFPDLALHKPEALSVARAMGCNEQVVSQWHKQYKKTVTELGIEDRPSHIWNCDESGLQDMFVPSKVVGERGKPSYQVTSAEKGETVTVLAGFNAVGKFTPLLVLFKGKRMKPEWAVGSPCDTIVRMSDNGWITSETFMEWGKAFLNSLPKDGLPHLLLLDGHGSHVYNISFLDLMTSNNVHVMCFPSHTTHLLQPADVSLFKSLKANWTSEGLAFNRKSGGRRPGKSDFFRIFTPSWNNAATVANAQSGFRSTGLFPVDYSAIPKHVFLPSQTTERPLSAAVLSVDTTGLNSTTGTLSQSLEVIANAAAAVETVSTAADEFHGGDDVTLDAGNNSTKELSESVGTCGAAGTLSTGADNVESGNTVEAASSLGEGDGRKNRFEEILPVPTRTRPVSTRKRNKPPSHILTSKQHADFLQEISDRKAKKDAKGQKSKKMPASMTKGRRKTRAKNNGRSSVRPTRTAMDSGSGIAEDNCVCDICREVFGDLTASKADEDWLCCSKCDSWLHETCAEMSGLVDVAEFICGQCF